MVRAEVVVQMHLANCVGPQICLSGLWLCPPKNGDRGSVLSCSLRSVKLIWGPLLLLSRLREEDLMPKGSGQWGPPEVERSTPHFMVSVSLQCPQGTVLPTLPLLVLQGAAVSGERISQGPHGNVVALGCSPPPRRVSEWSAQMLHVESPFQDVVLTAQLHINPETNLERLVPPVEFWLRGNFCQIYLVGSCRL